MKTILFMALSADGMIADVGGSEDFLSDVNWRHFVELAQQVGNFVYGRKTYEAVCSWGDDYLAPLNHVTKIVLSKSEITLKHGFIQAKSIDDLFTFLKARGSDSVIIAGGSSLNQEFAKAGCIDEIILLVSPVLLGKGMPLFAHEQLNLRLELKEVNALTEQIVKLHYQVVKDEE